MKKIVLCLILSLLTLLGTGFVLSGCKSHAAPPEETVTPVEPGETVSPDDPEETVPPDDEPPKGGLVNGGVYIARYGAEN